MQTALVTGGAGFIGSHLCDYLLDKGLKVICVDNLITGSDKNIRHLLTNKNFEFTQADITQSLSSNLQPLNFIYHLASPASPADFSKIPEEIALTNSVGAINILELAKKTKAKLLTTSTSEVYGDPLEHPQKETYWGNVNSFGPRACYDESKRFSETMSYIYVHKYDLDLRVIRIFNTYGPRMRRNDGRALINFVSWALEDKPIEIYGDGTQTRSFCYVSDMVEGIYKAMTEVSTEGEIFNLGNPDEYSMNDLAKKIRTMVGSKSEIVYKPILPDDPKRRKPDISKAKKILGWEPKVSLEDGLGKTIEYYRNNQ